MARVLATGGLTPLSTVDFPGRLAAVLYAQGCPLRCPYCHNPHLQGARPDPGVSSWAEILAGLDRRRGLLDGIVFSGGEPTAQSGLISALRQVRNMGFATALHTSGIHPKRLKEALPLLDWVGLDFKAPLAGYPAITGLQTSGTRASQALDLLLASGISCEIRTTVHPRLLSEKDLVLMAELLQARGVSRWVLQEFRKEGCQDSSLCHETESLSDKVISVLREMVPGVRIRRA